VFPLEGGSSSSEGTNTFPGSPPQENLLLETPKIFKNTAYQTGGDPLVQAMEGFIPVPLSAYQTEVGLSPLVQAMEIYSDN
jgi:hypothetical protein